MFDEEKKLVAAIRDIEDYFKARTRELKSISANGTPWEFLCMSAFIEYLSKLVYGKDRGHQGYKDFVKDYLSQINSSYVNFSYKNQSSDLPDQMYHVLRCGIVHAFSLVPDKTSAGKGGRLRSIVLIHKAAGRAHLSSYSSSDAPDAAVFVSQDFADDIEKVVDYIFKQASAVPALQVNIETWFNQQPPITGNI